MTEREPEMLVYPIEIRPGLVAQVRAPVDMTRTEAEKISRVVLALGDGELTIPKETK